jgi:hypothetical protein
MFPKRSVRRRHRRAERHRHRRRARDAGLHELAVIFAVPSVLLLADRLTELMSARQGPEQRPEEPASRLPRVSARMRLASLRFAHERRARPMQSVPASTAIEAADQPCVLTESGPPEPLPSAVSVNLVHERRMFHGRRRQPIAAGVR